MCPLSIASDPKEAAAAAAIGETVVWICVACSIPVADLVLQCEELMRSRKSHVRT